MRSRTVTLDGTTLNTLDVFDVSHEHALVEIAGDAMQRVQIARNVVDRIVEEMKPSTGSIPDLDRSFIPR